MAVHTMILLGLLLLVAVLVVAGAFTFASTTSA